MSGDPGPCTDIEVFAQSPLTAYVVEKGTERCLFKIMVSSAPGNVTAEQVGRAICANMVKSQFGFKEGS